MADTAIIHDPDRSPARVHPLPDKPRADSGRQPGKAEGRFRLLARFWETPATADLAHAEQAVWVYMWYLADRADQCFPSMERIGRHLGCTRRYVKALVSGLKAKGYLVVIHRGTNLGPKRANVYRIKVPRVSG